MTDSAKKEYLLKCDWGDIAKKLTAFVIHYLNHCVDKKYKDWNLPMGYKAEDVAYKAITDVLDGTRKWDPIKQPDFLKYMQFSVCRSIISNLLSKRETKVTIQAGQSTYSSTDESSDSIEYYNGACINLGLHFEQNLDNDTFLNKLEHELRVDETGQLVLLAVLSGNPTRDIAKDLGISENDVSNAKKRIKRAAEKIQSSL